MQLLKEVKFLLQKKKYSIEGVNLYFKEKNQLNVQSKKKIIIAEIEDLIFEIRNTISHGA